MSYMKEKLRIWYVKSQEIVLENQVYLNNFVHIFQNQSKTIKRQDWSNILNLMQMLWGNWFVEMQDFLQDQVLSSNTNAMQPISLFFELVNLLDKLSKKRNELYQDTFGSNLTNAILNTLIKSISGPSYSNQKFLGNWKKLHKILNIFIWQELKFMIHRRKE